MMVLNNEGDESGLNNEIKEAYLNKNDDDDLLISIRNEDIS